jgi:Na+/proline symporter
MELPAIPKIDALIVVAYLIVSFAIGLLASKLLRSSTKGEEGYYLAGRKMPGWLAGASVGVTAMNADVAPAYAGMAIVIGLPIAWFYLSRFALAWMIIAILFCYHWRRLRISTMPEFYRIRFGGTGGTAVRMWTAFWQIAVGMIPWIGAGLLGLHMIFSPVFHIEEYAASWGVDPKALTLAIVLPVLLIYVWISGYAGVVVTDLLQSLLIIGANVVIGILVLRHFGGPTGFSEAIRGAMDEKAAGEILSSVPVPEHRMFSPLAVLPWFIITTLGAGGGLATEGQRVFSTRNSKEAMKSFIWSEGILFFMLLTLTLPVLGLLPNHPELYTAEPAQRETAYGLLLKEFLPVGFLGLALAGLTASVMSTIDSHLNYGAQLMTNDVLRVLKPDIDERRSLLFGRIVTVVIMIASVVVVYMSDSLIGIAITLMGLFGSTQLFAWAQWWWWRTNLISWITAMFCGPLIYLLLFKALPLLPAWEAYAEAGGATAEQTLAMFQAVIGMALSTTVWVTVALVTKPEKMDVLKRFYKEARPMGMWGPVRQAILDEEGPEALPPQKPMILQGLGVSVLGTSWIVLAILCLSQLYVGQYITAAVCGASAVVLAIAFKFAFSWYHERLEGEFQGQPAAPGTTG